jgi:hypothetical protein
VMPKITTSIEIFLFTIRLWRTSSLSGCDVVSVENLVKHHERELVGGVRNAGIARS